MCWSSTEWTIGEASLQKSNQTKWFVRLSSKLLITKHLKSASPDIFQNRVWIDRSISFQRLIRSSESVLPTRSWKDWEERVVAAFQVAPERNERAQLCINFNVPIKQRKSSQRLDQKKNVYNRFERYVSLKLQIANLRAAAIRQIRPSDRFNWRSNLSRSDGWFR